ncbi:MAG: FAD-binding and (Fe-S)-binding domain-containing protein [Pseudorhizobium sp.]
MSERSTAAAVSGAEPQAGRLEAELRAAIAGDVRFDTGSRALYATDASNYRQVPIGVVQPKTYQDVEAALAVCRRFDVPVLSRGCGTSLSGETCNAAVILDFSRYLNRVIQIDPERRVARVQAGCILDDLRNAAEQYGLTFGPDPATHNHCTLGGMIGNNSGGVHALMAGLTVHNVCTLDVVTYEGLRLRVGPLSADERRNVLSGDGPVSELYRKMDALRGHYEGLLRERYPRIARRVSGYENLDQLYPENGMNVARALVGTEGTCVTVLEAELQLIKSPKEHAIAILGFPDVYEAADAVPEVLEHKPIGLEGMDHLLAEFVRKKDLDTDALSLLPDGQGWLICQMGADTAEEAEAQARELCERFDKRGISTTVIAERSQRGKIWNVRESALAATAWVPDADDTWPGWEDSAVHRENLGDYLRALKDLLHRYGYEASLYGHFGDGLVHCRINFDLRQQQGIETWRRFLDDAAALVHRFDGSLSGEHGDGQARGELLESMYGPELVQCFREFKAIWDPRGRMNPGKVVDPNPVTSNLRVGPDYAPPSLDTHFAFETDQGSFARAAMRCVGVGKCRRTDSEEGVMCPSFLVTREEKHSTRGRAHLLFEMVHGGVIEDGWRSPEVEDALKLCLACKGCKSDCPVNVDMATYKAEFRSHFYKGRLRPRAAYSMGLIYWWARLGAKVPALANLALKAPILGGLLKALGGIAPERSMPKLADESFREWFNGRETKNSGPRVLLWPDTFNNFFRPQTAIAATEVLEAAGFTVAIPPKVLCCGRPLYDQGMLDTARRLLRQILVVLKEDIEAGTPVIGLEPACTTTFKDELLGLFPDDPLAQRLGQQTIFFSDFINEHLDRLDLTAEGRSALVHFHCNHHAVLKRTGELSLLDRLGLEAQASDAGCCGMAGAFGFAKETYPLSVAIGEQKLLPMLRELSEDRLVLADGFSCREQIEQQTGRTTLHVAELLYQLHKQKGERHADKAAARERR